MSKFYTVPTHNSDTFFALTKMSLFWGEEDFAKKIHWLKHWAEMQDWVTFSLFEFENLFAFVFWNPPRTRFVNFSFPKKALTNRVLLTNRGLTNRRMHCIFTFETFFWAKLKSQMIETILLVTGRKLKNRSLSDRFLIP